MSYTLEQLKEMHGLKWKALRAINVISTKLNAKTRNFMRAENYRMSLRYLLAHLKPKYKFNIVGDVITNGLYEISLVPGDGIVRAARPAPRPAYVAPRPAPVYVPTPAPAPAYVAAPKKSTFGGKKNMLGLTLGRISDSKLALSVYGPVIRQKDNSFAYFDKPQGQMVTVPEEFMVNIDNAFYAFPVQTVAAGDLISINGILQYVTGVDGNAVETFNPRYNRIETVVQPSTVFGFKFYTKIISLFDASGNNNLGGFNPMILMLLDKAGEEDNDVVKMLLLTQCMGTQGGAGLGNINPMMLMLLADRKGSGDNMLSTMLMMSAMGGKGLNIFQAPTAPAVAA